MTDQALIARVASAFDNARVARAPGRVNLIGGQIDYHEGPVVAMALDREVMIGFAPRRDDRIVVRSLDIVGTVNIAADGSDDPATVEPSWGRLVGGVVHELAQRGIQCRGIDALIGSNLAIGGGLSSSAAFAVALALALQDVVGTALPRNTLVDALQAAEFSAANVACGIQDQTASLAGIADHALLIDCRSREISPLAIPSDARVIVIDSGVPRTLEGSPWASRRAESFAVARQLGLQVLRDATFEMVADSPRGRHVVSEIERVGKFVDALTARDLVVAGALMLQSHESSRDDMEVSIPELDILVECLLSAGAFGARLTGGGFGGCCVALVPADSASGIADEASTRYRRQTGRTPSTLLARAAAGAAILP